MIAGRPQGLNRLAFSHHPAKSPSLPESAFQHRPSLPNSLRPIQCMSRHLLSCSLTLIRRYVVTRLSAACQFRRQSIDRYHASLVTTAIRAHWRYSTSSSRTCVGARGTGEKGGGALPMQPSIPPPPSGTCVCETPPTQRRLLLQKLHKGWSRGFTAIFGESFRV